MKTSAVSTPIFPTKALERETYSEIYPNKQLHAFSFISFALSHHCRYHSSSTLCQGASCEHLLLLLLLPFFATIRSIQIFHMVSIFGDLTVFRDYRFSGDHAVCAMRCDVMRCDAMRMMRCVKAHLVNTFVASSHHFCYYAQNSEVFSFGGSL